MIRRRDPPEADRLTAYAEDDSLGNQRLTDSKFKNRPPEAGIPCEAVGCSYCHHPDDRGRGSGERQGCDGGFGDVVWVKVFEGD